MLKPISVSALTSVLKEFLESAFPSVCVEGEISNFRDHAASGHMYFTLKDDKSQVRCTLWKWSRRNLRFMPENGMKVVITGNIRIYEKNGEYNLNVQNLEPSGVGALQLAFEQLKAKLEKEGLFDASRKRPIPEYPGTIGIVTSAGGAALRDIINVLRRRMPGVRIVLNPAAVQGEGAAGEIARAIDEFNEWGGADVLIVGRGGGSLEDLWAFNEEPVARSIARSGIPVISAVGHEVDYTIADFAADLRAPTPSAAAELAVRERDALVLAVKACADRIAGALLDQARNYRERLERLCKAAVLTRPHALVEQWYQRLDGQVKLFHMAFKGRMETARAALKEMAGRLEALNPLNVLSRGYSMTLCGDKILTSASRVKPGDEILTRLLEGSVRSRVI